MGRGEGAAFHRPIAISSLDRFHADTAIASLEHRPTDRVDRGNATESAVGDLCERLGSRYR